jgi:hypothetical protein
MTVYYITNFIKDNNNLSSDKIAELLNTNLISDQDMNIKFDKDLLEKHTKIFHWSDAVGYWRVGADSAKVERMAANGFGGVHFAGENYSRLNQQWLEGSLDTAENVLRILLADNSARL